MITVLDAKTRLAKSFQKKLATWAVAPFGLDSPVSLGLKPPTDRQATAALSTVGQWVEQWSRVEVPDVEIIWETRRWPNSGTQKIPVRFEASSPAGLARFLSLSRRWNTQHERAQRLLTLQDSADDQTTNLHFAITKVLAKVELLSDADFDSVFDVLAWLNRHPNSGLFARQIPVEGIDSKWFERHNSIVRPLHIALGGDDDLGLASIPKQYRVRFLDPSISPAGIDDLMAPLSTLARITAEPHTVLIVENLQTLLALPNLPGVVAVHGAGYDVRWCADIPWIAAAQLLYWGDLDADGLNILARLRGVLPDVRSIMMDPSTLRRFENLAVPDPNGAGKSLLSGLRDGEIAAYQLIQELGGLRLEQERVDWLFALSQIREYLHLD